MDASVFTDNAAACQYHACAATAIVLALRISDLAARGLEIAISLTYVCYHMLCVCAISDIAQGDIIDSKA